MGRLYGYWVRKQEGGAVWKSYKRETSLNVIEKILGDDSQRANKRKVRRGSYCLLRA